MLTDQKYIYRALQLAALGEEGASPNPLVGAVVVYRDRIIGEGYHRRCGEPHAEVNAISSVKECDRKLLCDSTIYVTLEPCSHYGKTPPCAELIIKTGIPRVVVGTLDPFEKVSGRGVKMLQEAGIKVKVGVLEEECRNINRHFFISVTKQRPYILLKWAESRDGYIGDSRQQVAITSLSSNILSHRLRSRFDAIMVGTNTVITDNPSLGIRHWFGQNPMRVVVDKDLRIPSKSNVISDGNPTLIYTSTKSKKERAVEYIKVDFDNTLIRSILEDLNRRGIRSLMVEGGAQLLQSFIDAEMWDEAYRYTAPKPLYEEAMPVTAVKAPLIDESYQHSIENIGKDNLMIYTKNIGCR